MKAVSRLFLTVAVMTAIVVQAEPMHSTPLQVHHSGDNLPADMSMAVERAANLIDYRLHKSAATDLRGTPLLPGAKGEAIVETKQGYAEIKVAFEGLEDATRLGPEYLTYVMWAVLPEGRTINLAEVILDGDKKSQVRVRIDCEMFGLLVTGEPYFAVSQPSDVVIMEGVARAQSDGKIEQISAKYQLSARGTYTANVSQSALKPIVVDPSTPLHLYEARNAVWIALWTGAEEHASEAFARAMRSLQRAEAYHASNPGAPSVLVSARDAVETAEQARIIAARRQSKMVPSRSSARAAS